MRSLVWVSDRWEAMELERLGARESPGTGDAAIPGARHAVVGCSVSTAWASTKAVSLGQPRVASPSARETRVKPRVVRKLFIVLLPRPNATSGELHGCRH